MAQAYHGVPAAQHQANFSKFSAQGYRMISLSVYGDAGNPRYAAVWVKRSGPAWVGTHGIDVAAYQAFFQTWTAKGYAPVLVSATGTAGNAVFAAVFEQGVASPWLAHHGLTSGSATSAGTFQNANAAASANHMALRSVSIYGTANDRRYVAVWHANPAYVKCHVHPADTSASYQTVFNAETQLPGYRLAGYRPAYIALSGDATYCSVFKDDVVGDCVARHGLSAAEYQAEFDKQAAKGLYPICVQGGGTTASPVYAAIFAKQDVPVARAWSVSGTATAPSAGFDTIMHDFMKTNGVRAAQLAVSKHGKMALSRGYTWAEAGYRQTQPSDRFLLASCSKMFLEAAVQSLYDAKKLMPGTKVYPLLGFSHPADPRSDTITIQQLLDHTGGYDDSSAGSGYDPTYDMRGIALALGLAHPVTKLDIARHMYGKPLDYTPYDLPSPLGIKYSNFGHLLAGAVVEHVSGKTYADYVQTALLQPEGISEVRVISTLASGRKSDDAIAEDQGFGLSPLDLASHLQVPRVYGGDGEINEVGAPNDGMGASAEAMTQFIRHHAVWGNGPRAAGGARAGSTPGASSFAESRGDGVDWAYVINTRDWPPGSDPELLKKLGGSIDSMINAAALP